MVGAQPRLAIWYDGIGTVVDTEAVAEAKTCSDADGCWHRGRELRRYSSRALRLRLKRSAAVVIADGNPKTRNDP